MKKHLAITAVALLLAAALAYQLREPLREIAYAWMTRDMFVGRDGDNFDPGPATGSRFPGLRASYQGRMINLIEEFAGANGTVLIAACSLDWCPWCMRQMIQLQQYSAGFAAAGIGIVGITYDDPRLQQAFVDRFGIGIPILSDIDGLSFKTLGILDDRYRPGDERYGIPFPGMLVISPGGEIVGKLFLREHDARVDSAAALAFARATLGID